MVNFTATIPGQGGPGGSYYNSGWQTAGYKDYIAFGAPMTGSDVLASVYGPADWMVVNGHDFPRWSGSHGIHEQDQGSGGGPTVTAVNNINEAAASGYVILTSNTNANANASETINSLTVQSATAMTSNLGNYTLNIRDTSQGGGTALDSNGGICVSGSAPFTPSGGYTINGGTITAGNSANQVNAELLVWIDSGTTTINSAIQDNGARGLWADPALQNGSGTLVLGGANTYSYGTTLNAGVLSFANGSAPLQQQLAEHLVLRRHVAMGLRQQPGRLGRDRPDLQRLYGHDRHQRQLRHFRRRPFRRRRAGETGANTLTLTASNTYSGGTTISGGTLQLGDGTA